MVRELSLVKSTDQFTFIRTIKVTPGRNDSDKFTTDNLSAENLDNLVKPDQSSQEVLSTKQLSDKQLSDRQIQDSSALRPINQQNVSSHLSLNNHPISISDRWYQPDFQNSNTSLFLPEIIIPPLETKETEAQPKKSHSYLDKILVVAAIGYCGFLGWSLLGAQNSILPTALLRTKQPTISQADLNFLQYFEKSLAVIDSKPNQTKTSINKQATNKDKQDDLVYLPVYTPTPPVRSTSNNPLQPNSLLPPPPPPNNFAAFNPPVSNSPIKQPAPPSRSSANTNTKTPTSNNVSIASSSIPIPNNDQQAKAQKIAPQQQIQPTLVGIIELKTNSAALFKVNGNTEKIWLGDQVGNTGWKLVAINNQKAKISYQGNNLTLVIGQSFEATP